MAEKPNEIAKPPVAEVEIRVAIRVEARTFTGIGR